METFKHAPWTSEGVLEICFCFRKKEAAYLGETYSPRLPSSPHTGPSVTPALVLGPSPGLPPLQAQGSLFTLLEPLEIFRGVGGDPGSGVPLPHQSSTLSAGSVLVNFCATMAMVATQAVLSSSLASKILATGSLAKAGGAAVGSVLAGLPSAGECSQWGARVGTGDSGIAAASLPHLSFPRDGCPGFLSEKSQREVGPWRGWGAMGHLGPSPLLPQRPGPLPLSPTLWLSLVLPHLQNSPPLGFYRRVQSAFGKFVLLDLRSRVWI